jgi:hypothetical protein
MALPESFPLILGRHHDPPSGSAADILGVVYHGCRLADALGFSVLKPLRPATVEEIRAALPEPIAGRFTAYGAELAAMVEEKIRQHDSGGAAALVVPVAAAEPAAPAGTPQPDPRNEEVAWDALVAGTTAAIILAVLAVCSYFAAP